MMDDLVLLSGQISKHIENTTKYHHIKNNTKYHHIGNTTTYHHHFFPPRIVVFNKILDPLCTNNVDYMVATVNGGSIFGWANRHKVWRLKDWWMVVREEFSSKITYWKIVNVYPYCTLLVRRWKEPKISSLYESSALAGTPQTRKTWPWDASTCFCLAQCVMLGVFGHHGGLLLALVERKKFFSK